jgi:phenylalanyl-tRNA synthetase beta chain
MRVSFRWLKELLEIPAELGPREVADRLTLVGLEVEAVTDLGAVLRGVVLGYIQSSTPHPDAGHLSVCVVDVGDAAPLTIVCGAPNCAAGKLVPVARVGIRLPGGLTIAERVIRGVCSQGMLCSAPELGLPQGDGDRILIIEGSHPPGAPLSRALGLEDHVLEIAVTPNRPDALSHVGMARDLAALLSVHPASHAATATEESSTRRQPAGSSPTNRVKMPPATCAERGGPVDDAAQIRVEDSAKCPRYAARVLEGVTVGASPVALQRRLEACGMRSINNVVDVTNLVLLERGHPLHAFDLDRMGLERGRPTVVIRTAKSGEHLVTLDGVDRLLDVDDLVIADPERPLALAGVMGGRDSEVTGHTTRILLEAAYFQPAGIRRTSKRHGLHTEASHRFERGCDPNRTLEEALNRAAQMIVDVGGGQVRRGVVQVYPKPVEPLEVTLRPARAAMLLGLPQKAVDEAMVARTLTSLGLEVAGREPGALRFRVPTHRPDLTLEVDLVEEVGRLLGLDRIPEVLPRGSGKLPTGPALTPLAELQEVVRGLMTAAGFDEAVNLGFVSQKEMAPFERDGQLAARLTLRNPISEDLSILRSTLLAGLLRNVLHNQRRGERDVRLFELGTVFFGARAEGIQPRPQAEDGPAGGDAYAIERRYLAAVMTGHRHPQAFDTKPGEVDFYDMKGVVEELLEGVGLKASPWAARVNFHPLEGGAAWPYLHPGMGAEVRHGATRIGVLGVLHPALVERLELREPVLVVELDLSSLVPARYGQVLYQTVPRFPAVRRDLAALLDESVSLEGVFDTVRMTPAAKAGLVEDVALFDLYRGENIPKGKKSVAISVTFRAADRTLTDDEVNNLHQDVMQFVEHRLRAEVRKG